MKVTRTWSALPRWVTAILYWVILWGLEINGNGNTLQNNYIGTDATGTRLLASGGTGVDIAGSNNTFGGTTPGTGNLVSGWSDIALFIKSAAHTIVQGNLIGTDASGLVGLGNRVGIGLGFNASENTIGEPRRARPTRLPTVRRLEFRSIILVSQVTIRYVTLSSATRTSETPD